MLIDRALILFGFPSEPEPQYAHPPNLRETRRNLEFEYDFETNSQGLRYREIPLEKPEGTYRVLLAGDSFTEGTGVEMEETFSTALERQAEEEEERRIDFINAGPLDHDAVPRTSQEPLSGR